MKKKLFILMMTMMLCGSLVGCQKFLSFKNGETETQSESESEELIPEGTGEETSGETEANTEEETENSSQSPEQTEEQTPAQTPEQTPAQTPAPTNPAPGGQPVVGGTQTPSDFSGEILQLPNEPIPFGYAKKDRDAMNVPTGVYYYKNLYAKYGADFIQDTSQKVIYLTLDEGYEIGNTAKILDVLKAKNVSATFFITKQFYDSHPELIQRMIDEGHVVGNHTCAHPSGGMPQLGADGIRADVRKLEDLVRDRFGYEMTLFRFPEGTFSEQALAVIKDMGYQSVFWSFAYADWNTSAQPDPAASLNEVLSQIHPGAIYLLHAVSDTNTAIMADFIDGARALGYEFGVYPH